MLPLCQVWLLPERDPELPAGSLHVTAPQNNSPRSDHMHRSGRSSLGLALWSPSTVQCGSFEGSGDDRYPSPRMNTTME